MTYPMSLCSRALIPRQEGAGTVGYWRASDEVSEEYSDSVGRARALMMALPTPPRAIEDRRLDVRSLGRGMGLLGWGVYLALSQGDATHSKGDRSVIIVMNF